MRDRRLGVCAACGRKLLLEPQRNLCAMCEIDFLRQRLLETELALSQCRRDKQALYEKLSRARAGDPRQ